jgi:hypothetical protein
MRAAWHGLVSLLVLSSALAAGPAVDAQARPRARAVARASVAQAVGARAAIAVGDFGARAGGVTASDELELAMRSALSTHPRATLAGDRADARFVVTGSVVELSERELADDEREVRCRVSIVVADARGGSVRAMLEGRAGVRGGGSEESLRRSALRGAVQSALRSIDQVR